MDIISGVMQMTDSSLPAFNCIKNFSNINVSVTVNVFSPFLFHCPKHQGYLWIHTKVLPRQI